MSTGFQIGQTSQEDVLRRIEELKDSTIFPMDESGSIIEDDGIAHESAREIRLLLQRLLDLDASTFLVKMRELYFHLFSVDHDHYRDLLLQAARRSPEATRDFCLDFLLSKEVLFLDDQENLHSLLDVLEILGLAFIPEERRREMRDLLTDPFSRLPSLQARLVRILSPSLREHDVPAVRQLFEMDLIPKEELTWDQIRPAFATLSISPSLLEAPTPKTHQFLARFGLEDFERLRWSVGMEGTPMALKLRLLGSLVAHGPAAPNLFFEVSEAQPDTAFHRKGFETDGQRIFFLRGLEIVREEILRDVHRSTNWFVDVLPERTWSWMPPPAVDPWPLSLRFLATHWGEFANPTDGSEFANEHKEAIAHMDRIADLSVDLLMKHPLPLATHLDMGDLLLKDFTDRWERLLSAILPRLDVVP